MLGLVTMKNGKCFHRSTHFPGLIAGKILLQFLYWGGCCINRHTGNRPSLSEEPLKRGPGPMARFPTVRYRPGHYRHLECNDVLWNPSTFWEAVGIRSSDSLESACLLYKKLNYHFLFFYLLQPKPHSFTIHLLVYASFPLCHDVQSCYLQQRAQVCLFVPLNPCPE